VNIIGLRKSIVSFSFILLIHFCILPVAFAHNLNMSPAKKNSHPKMSSYLDKLEKEYKEGTGAARMVAQGMNITPPSPDKVMVYLMSGPGKIIDEDVLDNFGITIIKRSDNVIRAEIPINMLTAVTDNVKGVSFIKTPDKLIPVAVTSEGGDLTGADTYHSVGHTGSGVKVAVIDVGFAGLSSAISSGELPDFPDNLKRIDCTGACVPSDFSSEEDSHGTAVAEIVYDMAPDATLYLIKVEYLDDLRDAKNYAVNNGIRIINHSLVVPNTNFYDGECWTIGGLPNAVCTAEDAYDKNILWVNAAGNGAQKHYWADFKDSDKDGWHDVTVNGADIDETIEIYAKADPEYPIKIFLTWDAWPVTDQDYDLYLFDSSLNPLDPDPSSTDDQTVTQSPTEYISYQVPADGFYYLAIYKKPATSNHRLQLFSINHDLNPAIADRSILSPADSAWVLAVGAINYTNWTTGPQASYSSQGPTNEGPTNDGRIKPDIMGPDNVTNYTSLTINVKNFAGTSASTPHVAGAAALVLEKFPGTSAYDLKHFLTSTAIDMGIEEEDNIYGHGRLRLDINAVIPSSIAVTTGGGGGGGGGCFIATAAFGSYAAPCVRILRKMRDRFLMKNSIGKSLVNLYYKYSPPLADFIANHDNVKIFVRLSLLPLVGISWLALKCGPVLIISFMVLFVFAVIRLFPKKTSQTRK